MGLVRAQRGDITGLGMRTTTTLVQAGTACGHGMLASTTPVHCVSGMAMRGDEQRSSSRLLAPVVIRSCASLTVYAMAYLSLGLISFEFTSCIPEDSFTT